MCIGATKISQLLSPKVVCSVLAARKANSMTPISPIAMNGDGKSRANNDENVVVESLSIT